MDAVLKIAGVCICAVCAALILGERNRSAAVLCSIAAIAAVMYFVIGGAVGDTVQALRGVYGGEYVGEYAEVLAKALAVSYITSAASEICESAGEAGLSRAASLGGRAEILALCMPMILKLLETASGMLKNI